MLHSTRGPGPLALGQGYILITTAGSTSKVVIEELQSPFSQFGLPESIVSDNGTCFTSSEFEGFLKLNGNTHVKSAHTTPPPMDWWKSVVIIHFCGYVSFTVFVMWIYIVERVPKISVFIELNWTVASHCGACIQADYYSIY